MNIVIRSTFIHFVILLSLIFISASKLWADPPPAYEGRRLYVSYCQLCHGTGGKGDGPLAVSMDLNPADLTTTVRSRSDTILTKIITGRGGQTITGRVRHNLLSDAMPEWENLFDESQIKSLIAYLRFMSTTKFKLQGDPKAGMQLYQKYCHVCHGVEGDGDGIMIDLIGIAPMDHTNPNETNALSNKDIVKSILDGKGRFMPAWRGILTQSDAEALVSYIRLLAH